MIASFGDRTTADLFDGIQSRRVARIPSELRAIALRKLDMLNAAHELEYLRSPPGNRLEALKGNLAGFHSIRINRQ